MTVPLADALDLAGRTVLVTGGTKGVGRGIAQRFLEAGANVVVSARSAPEATVSHGAHEAVFLAADVRDAEQVDALVTATVERLGRLDVVVNNAGGAPAADAATASPRFSQSIIALNLTAPLLVSQAANRVMQAQHEGGCIVNIGSVSALRPSPGTAAYGAAKAGLRSLTQSLAVEWAPKVRVNLVTGGLIRTEQSHLHYGDEEGIRRVAATVPLGRMATPSDIGDACVFLASPLASYISGADLVVHGGGERPAFLEAAEG